VRSLVDTLSWLVDIPSATGSEQAIQKQIAGRLTGVAPVNEVGDSLIVGVPEPGKVILAGHTDTVPLQGEAGSRVEGDRLYGLGSTDMKGGLAVMIHLLEELGTERMVGVFYAGEEGPLSGNQLGSVLDSYPALIEAEAAIVMEPTNREVHAGCQGSVNAVVWFEGEAAHSARPWLGVNAVTRAGPFLTTMAAREPELHMIEGLPFKEVISVTRAKGGVANNIIPSRFELNLNYRFSPDRSIEEAIANLALVCADADGFEVSDAAPAAHPAIDHPLFMALVAASAAVVGHKQGWTDVAQFAERGVPAINFGPGDAELAHKPGESVLLADLDWAHEALRQVLA
jgi:succinyl-diaminopimelate desuccinylase